MTALDGITRQLKNLHLSDQQPSFTIEEPTLTVTDLAKLAALGITDEAGLLLQPKTLASLPATTEMKENVCALLTSSRTINDKITSLKVLCDYSKTFLARQGFRAENCILVDEELFKILGYDYLIQKFLHLTGDSHGHIASYLSDEVISRLQKDCKKPLSALTIRFMLPSELSDENRHSLMIALHLELTQFLGQLPHPFQTNDSNRLSGSILTFADLRLTIAFCTSLPNPCFSTLSAYQIDLYDNAMRILDHNWSAQSTIDIVFKQLRLMPNESRNQSRLLLKLVGKNYRPVADALKTFEHELFLPEAGAELLIDFWYRDRSIRDLFLLADIGLSLGYEEIVNAFVARALKGLPETTKDYLKTNTTLLEKISFRQWLSLTRLFSPLLLQTHEPILEVSQPTEEDLKVYCEIAQKLQDSPEFSDWLSFFTVRSTGRMLPKALFPMFTSSEHTYLPSLCYAVVSKNPDLAKHALGLYLKNDTLKKIAPQWITALLRLYNVDVPRESPKFVDQLLASPHFRKIAIELLVAHPGQYKKNKLSLIASLLSADLITAIRFISDVYEEATEPQVKEWIKRCPQKELLYDALVRTGNVKWITLCVQSDPDIALSVYTSTKSTRLLEEITCHASRDSRLVSLWSQSDFPFTEKVAVRLLSMLAENQSQIWSEETICCVKKSMESLDSAAREKHIHEFAELFATSQAVAHVPTLVKAAFELLAAKSYPLTRATRATLFAPAVAVMLEKEPMLLSCYQKMKSRYIEEKPATKVQDSVVQKPKKAKAPAAKKAPVKGAQEDPFEKAFFDSKATAALFSRSIKQKDKKCLERLAKQASPLNMVDSLFLLDHLELLEGVQQKAELRTLLHIFIEILLKLENPTSHLKNVYKWLKTVGVDFELAWLMLDFSPKINSQELFEEQCRLISTIIHLKKNSSLEKIAKYFALAKKFAKTTGAVESVVQLITLLHSHKSNEVDFATVRALSDYPCAIVKEALLPLIPGFLSGLQSPSEFLSALLQDAPLAVALEVYHKFSVESQQTIQNFAAHRTMIVPTEIYRILGQNYGRVLQECIEKRDPLIARRALAIDFSFSKLPKILYDLLKNKIVNHAALLEKLFFIQLVHYNWDEDNMHYYDHSVHPQLGPHFIPVNFAATSVSKPALYREEYLPAITLLSSRRSYQGFLKPEDAMNHIPKILTILPYNYASTDQILPSEQKYVECIESGIREVQDESKRQVPKKRALLLDTAAENIRNLIDLFPKTAHIPQLLADFAALVDPNDAFYPVHKDVVQTLRLYSKIDMPTQNLATLQQIEAEVDALLVDPESTLTERKLFDLQKRFIIWQETECIDAYQERSNCLMKFFELWKKFPSITLHPAVLDSLVTIIKPASRYFGFHDKEKTDPYVVHEATSYLTMQLELLKKEPPKIESATPKIIRDDGKTIHLYTLEQMGSAYKRVDIFIDALKNIVESRIFYTDFELFYPFAKEAIAILTKDRKIDVDFCIDFSVTLTKALCTPFNQKDSAKKRLALLDEWLTSMSESCKPKEYSTVMSKIAREIVKAGVVFDFTKEQKVMLVRWIAFFDAIRDPQCKTTFLEQFYSQLHALNNTLPEKIVDLLPITQ